MRQQRDLSAWMNISEKPVLAVAYNGEELAKPRALYITDSAHPGLVRFDVHPRRPDGTIGDAASQGYFTAAEALEVAQRLLEAAIEAEKRERAAMARLR